MFLHANLNKIKMVKVVDLLLLTKKMFFWICKRLLGFIDKTKRMQFKASIYTVYICFPSLDLYIYISWPSVDGVCSIIGSLAQGVRVTCSFGKKMSCL